MKTPIIQIILLKTFDGKTIIGFSFDIKPFGDVNWGWFLLFAIGIIFFAFMILAVPAFGVANIIAWTGLAFIFGGAFRIILSFRLKKWKSAMGLMNFR